MRITGWLIPAATSNYNFFIRSDDSSQFFLNTSGATFPDPTTATVTVEETGCCKAFLEPTDATVTGGDPVTTTTPISLTAGTKYGYTILLKEGGPRSCERLQRRVPQSISSARPSPARRKKRRTTWGQAQSAELLQSFFADFAHLRGNLNGRKKSQKHKKVRDYRASLDCSYGALGQRGPARSCPDARARQGRPDRPRSTRSTSVGVGIDVTNAASAGQIRGYRPVS